LSVSGDPMELFPRPKRIDAKNETWIDHAQAAALPDTARKEDPVDIGVLAPTSSRTEPDGVPRLAAFAEHDGWVEPGGNRGDSQRPNSRAEGGRRQPERLDGTPFRTLSSFNVGHPASLRTTEGKRNSGKPLAGNGGAKSLSGTRIQCQGVQPVNCFLRTEFGVASALYSLRATNSSLRSG
jgi:hypothetical protein